MMLDLVQWLRNEATLYGSTSQGKDLRDRLNAWAQELEFTYPALPYETVRELLPQAPSSIHARLADGQRTGK